MHHVGGTQGTSHGQDPGLILVALEVQALPKWNLQAHDLRLFPLGTGR